MSAALELTETKHKKGCKADKDRMEAYEATRPSGDPVAVVRCMDCGNADIHEQSIKEFLNPKTEEKPEKGKSNG